MLYRQKLAPNLVKGKIAIVIDDGLASGYTMIAAINSLKQRKASRVIVAVPVASGSAFDLVKPQVDDIIAVRISRTGWFAVASYYQDWYDLTDEDVLHYLDKWRATFKSPSYTTPH
jgi:predicted phosphoribosyltransferase